MGGLGLGLAASPGAHGCTRNRVEVFDTCFDTGGGGPETAAIASCARCWSVLIRQGWDRAGWRALGGFGLPTCLYVPGAARGGFAVEGVKRTDFLFGGWLLIGIGRGRLRIERRGRLMGMVVSRFGVGGDGLDVESGLGV